MDKPKSTIKLYQILLYVSLGYIVVSLLLPLSTSCEYFSDEDVVFTKQFGLTSSTYYINLLVTLCMLMASFVERGSLTALMIIFFIGVGYVLYANFLRSGGWGKPCGHSATIYQYLLYGANVILFIACLERINDVRKREEKESK